MKVSSHLETKYLGMMFNSKLGFKKHQEYLCQKVVSDSGKHADILLNVGITYIAVCVKQEERDTPRTQLKGERGCEDGNIP